VSAVDLGRYERVKFGLAEAIRSAELAVREREGDPSARSQAERSWRDLLTRLAEDRFTVVVAGRFNRGKSSLMNAILGTDRLPTGVVPLTSVITCVRYGTSERVVLEYQGPRLAAEARVEELAEYVTERGNPGNAKGLRLAEIQLPAEILRRGFLFVDTPGLGSAIFENTRTTENFLSEIDVLILVTSYDSPLTADEVRFLERAAAAESVRAIYVVVNKHDMLPPGSRAEVLEYVTGAAAAVLGERLSRPFSVSARDGRSSSASSRRTGRSSSYRRCAPACSRSSTRFLGRTRRRSRRGSGRSGRRSAGSRPRPRARAPRRRSLRAFPPGKGPRARSAGRSWVA
jgi:GTP-binding protein EngB required for normal cell division